MNGVHVHKKRPTSKGIQINPFIPSRNMLHFYQHQRSCAGGFPALAHAYTMPKSKIHHLSSFCVSHVTVHRAPSDRLLRYGCFPAFCNIHTQLFLFIASLYHCVVRTVKTRLPHIRICESPERLSPIFAVLYLSDIRRQKTPHIPSMQLW